MSKASVKMNKPIYVGFSVLELSKVFMYDFYYNNLRKKYGEKIEVLYTDTDSLLLEIKTEDPYSDIAEDIEEYDTSDYPKEHVLHSEKNKKVIGKMKDEMAGKPISEYIGLRAKMYSIQGPEGNLTKKAKGVSKVVIKKDIKHENYKKVLEEHKVLRHEMLQLRSNKHNIFMNRVNKISLSPTDTKKYIKSDGINTLPFGHYKIKEQLEEDIDAMIDDIYDSVESSNETEQEEFASSESEEQELLNIVEQTVEFLVEQTAVSVEATLKDSHTVK